MGHWEFDDWFVPCHIDLLWNERLRTFAVWSNVHSLQTFAKPIPSIPSFRRRCWVGAVVPRALRWEKRTILRRQSRPKFPIWLRGLCPAGCFLIVDSLRSSNVMFLLKFADLEATVSTEMEAMLDTYVYSEGGVAVAISKAASDLLKCFAG